jgi:phage/plasmid-associated DNA primase
MITIAPRINTNVYSHYQTEDEVLDSFQENQYNFEVVKGQCVPVFDFDIDYKHAETQEEKMNIDIAKAYRTVNLIFDNIDKDDKFKSQLQIYLFESCGKKKDGYINSIRVIVRNGQKFESLKDFSNYYKLEELKKTYKMLDTSIYKDKGSQQKIRLPYQYKDENDKRFFKYVCIDNEVYYNYCENNDRGFDIIDNLEDAKSECDNILEWFASYTTDNEKLIKVNKPKEETKKETKTEIKTDECDLTPEDIKQLGIINFKNKIHEYNEYFKWVRICRHYEDLKNIDIYEDCKEICQLTKDNNFNERELRKLYYSDLPEKKFTHATLVHECKTDYPEEYKKWKDNKYPKISDGSDEGILMESRFNDADVADYYMSKHGKNVKFFDKHIYSFNGNYWERNAECENIYNTIIEDIYKTLRKFIDAKFTKLGDSKIHAEYIKKLDKLRNNKTIKNIIEVIKNKATIQTDIFDKNNNLFGFNNGVYDLEKNEFREGKYEDYISMTTGYDFKNKDSEQKNIGILKEWLKSIFPESDELEYYLKVASTDLCGRNIQHFFILLGNGSNGKDVLSKLKSKAYGKYHFNANRSILQISKENSTNPEIANCGKKRCIEISEPNDKETIKAAFFKQFTGSDKLLGRMLYSNQTTHSNNGTYYLLCNPPIPYFDKLDGGVERRINIIKFRSKFVEPGKLIDYTDEKGNLQSNIFVKNQYYETDEFHETYKMAFIHLLIEYYEKFKEAKYLIDNIPEKLQQENTTFISNNDDLYCWFKEKYIKSDELEIWKIEQKKDIIINNILQLKDIYDEYKSSDLFINLSKAEKRKNNYSIFREKIIEKDIFKKCYFERKKMNNKDYKNILVGWSKKPYEYIKAEE